ncbi:hypothetical protein COHA_009851 [Chlorella ohadii]|uniref:Uncharacterized protein n=1 Tax=Chlorella ohadii TaxID=2649997 RepID=A0AAD5DGB6_9CHLO|nr:hypothetical protein COHA_009851 [Chlorella ohadii]
MPTSVRKVVAASPTAAWANFWAGSKPGSTNAGNIYRWDGKVWARIRTGAAGETTELLKAVPAAGSIPGMAWVKLVQINTKGVASQTLLLCDAAKCTAQRAAGTTGTYPGSFLTPGGFDAASSKLALVWEVLPGNNPNKTTVALLQFNGAKWTAVMKVNVQHVQQGVDYMGEPKYVHSPELLVSIGSSTNAVALLAHQLPVASKTGTLVTHTWNGAKWAQQANATFEKGQDPAFESAGQVHQLQALSSGTALLTLFSGMWRLA